MSVTPIARQRRHTLYFLREIRGFAPVFLDTEVDMTAIREHREASKAAGRRYSAVTYIVHTASRALAKHPEANAAIRGGLWPKIARHDSVDAKVTLDKSLDGHRVVLSTVFPGTDTATLEQIQERVAHFRDGDPATMPEFTGARMLHKLPAALGRLAFAAGVRPLSRRAGMFGTFAVTSLGHRPVDGFHSVGGTTVTLGVGRIADRPVVRDGEIAVAPVMRLNLAFDHRVIDGAEAADLLADIKDGLEGFGAPPEEPQR